MKPMLELLPNSIFKSFRVDFRSYKYFPTPWHFHPEYELVLITKGSGKRFVGDNISYFEPGNLAFLGSNLPHTFKNEEAYYDPFSNLTAQSIVVQFSTEDLGKDFLCLPESKMLQRLFTRSSRGLDIIGNTRKLVIEKIRELIHLTGFWRWLKLIEILHLLSETKDFAYISAGAVTGSNEQESERMEDVLKYVLNNFSNDVSLMDAARVANMAADSFSHFFKQRTQKTFTHYLTEFRLSHAARLLIEKDSSISAICYECGFNNPSTFYHYFRKKYKTSPLNYRKEYWERAI